MDQKLIDKAFEYFETYFAVCEIPKILVKPDYYRLPKFMQIISINVYKPPMTKDEFFKDRPWLEKDEKLYDEYIQEDIKFVNEMRGEKIAIWNKYSPTELVSKFIMKKKN
jgi:hypothetical protein